MSYGFARRFSRHPEKFGTGVLDPAASPRPLPTPAASGIGTSLMKSLFNFN